MTASGSAVYESAAAVQEYLAFHYQTPANYFHFADGGGDFELGRMVSDKLLGFAQRCGMICYEYARATAAASGWPPFSPPVETVVPAWGRALDVGCAVGASSFELSKSFHEVVGVDFSAAFVAAAEAVRTTQCASYSRRVEGEPAVHLFPICRRAYRG